jgi:hypothetical protein
VSLGLSFSVFEVLVEDLGLESALDLMRRLFRAPPGDDARAVLERTPRTLLAAAGTDWQRLARQTETALQSARERHRAVLSARPPVTAHIDWRRSPERGIEIETRLAGSERYSVYYRQLNPWTASVARMPRLDVRGGRAVLPLAPNLGDRVLVVIEVEDPLLDCRTRVAAERLELG